MPGRLVLWCSAVLVLAAGCTSRPPREAAGKDVIRPSLGFALNVPKGWSWRDLGGDVVLEIVPSAASVAAADANRRERGGAVIHVVVVDRDHITPSSWADEAIEESQELQPDLEVTGRTKTILADGRNGLTVTLRSPRGLEPLVQRMLLAATKSRAYALIVTAPESTMASVAPAVQECFNSFVVW